MNNAFDFGQALLESLSILSPRVNEECNKTQAFYQEIFDAVREALITIPIQNEVDLNERNILLQRVADHCNRMHRANAIYKVREELKEERKKSLS